MFVTYVLLKTYQKRNVHLYQLFLHWWRYRADHFPLWWGDAALSPHWYQSPWGKVTTAPQRLTSLNLPLLSPHSAGRTLRNNGFIIHLHRDQVTPLKHIIGYLIDPYLYVWLESCRCCNRVYVRSVQPRLRNRGTVVRHPTRRSRRARTRQGALGYPTTPPEQKWRYHSLLNNRTIVY